MITFQSERFISKGKAFREGTCLSTDTKPTTDTTMANGSVLIEIDTSKIYFYNEASSAWLEWGEDDA